MEVVHPSQDPYRRGPDPRAGFGNGPGYSPPGYRPTVPGRPDQRSTSGRSEWSGAQYDQPRYGHDQHGQAQSDRPDARAGSRGAPGDRRPRGRAVQVDPVLVEIVVGLAWLAVGTLGLTSQGAGTLVLALGIGVGIWIGVENRRRGPQVFDPARSAEVLKLAGGAAAAVLVASILFGLIGLSGYLPGLSLVVTGAAFLMLYRVTTQRPTQWLGIVLVVLGALSAFLSAQTATGFASQGLLGLLAGILVLVSAADRVGLLAMLRDRAGYW